MNFPVHIRLGAEGLQASSLDAMLPLCVDLDGGLVHTDSLHEALAVASRDLPELAKALARLPGGKAPFKAAIYRAAALEADGLPYNEPLLEYLRAQCALGRRLVLVTAADRLFANAVATHLGLFDEVIASDGSTNVRGRTKADRLVERFGREGFAYAGNDSSGIEVWRVASRGILINASPALSSRVRAIVEVEHEFPPLTAHIGWAIKAMRPHQWAKNVLVFLPIIASTEFLDANAWLRTAILFASICCAASAIYVLNDLVDLNADRRHPRKRTRPFAAGQVSVKTGLLMSMALTAVALALAMPIGAVLLVAGYAVLSISYSFVLKEKALVDVFVLAALYTIRIFAGGVVSGHMVTEWLVGFSIFTFLSLAFAKRVAELLGTQARPGGQLGRRAYADQDIAILQTMGVASAFVSALVLSLYLQSQAAHSLYRNPQCLLFVVVAVLFWFARVWLQTSRGKMDDDPVVWAVKDRPSQMLGIATATALVAAIVKF